MHIIQYAKHLILKLFLSSTCPEHAVNFKVPITPAIGRCSATGNRDLAMRLKRKYIVGI